jgi:hypothetical protein
MRDQNGAGDEGNTNQGGECHEYQDGKILRENWLHRASPVPASLNPKSR